MLPVARKERLLVEDVGQEVVVYDQDSDQAHTLNRSAALVWRNCDGATTVAQMAAVLAAELGVPANEEIVWLALDRLDRAGLLAERPARRPGRATSRREAMRRLGAGAAMAMLALPAVATITAPLPAQAASRAPCLKLGERCNPGDVPDKCCPPYVCSTCTKPGAPPPEYCCERR
jgi:hypothetical protein